MHFKCFANYNLLFESSFIVFLQNIASKLSRIVPAFDSSRSENTSTACKIHTRHFIDALSRLELWAFQSNYYICFLFEFYEYASLMFCFYVSACQW